MPISIPVEPRICVVGSGTRFLSGISYYTYRLVNSFAERFPTSVILMRQLLPTKFYPGKARVGKPLSAVQLSKSIEFVDGIDWYLGWGFVRSIAMICRRRPNVMIFQWWTGTVLHIYLLLAFLCRLIGARVVIEFHEVLDTGEQKIPIARLYVRALMPLFVKLASGFVIHSEYDRRPLVEQYRIDSRPVTVIPHGPYDHYQLAEGQPVIRDAPEDSINLLYFGVIRPFKGLEDLVAAFDAIPEDQITLYWLTVAGEPWEGWTVPLKLIEQSRYRERITLIDRYLPDNDVAALFAGADIAVLPYHRSSASGPLHIAMSWGLPVITTNVGGLPEALSRYEGAVLIPPHDPKAIREALSRVAPLVGRRFASPHSWARSVSLYETLFSSLGMGE